MFEKLQLGSLASTWDELCMSFLARSSVSVSRLAQTEISKPLMGWIMKWNVVEYICGIQEEEES